MKLCFLFNQAPLYIESAYTLFDKELDIKWCFGSVDGDIKEMDHSLLKDVTVYPTRHLGKGYYLKGALSLAFVKGIDAYVLLGEPGFFTTWLLPLLVKVFHPSRKIIFWTHGWYGKEGRLKSLVKKMYFFPADKILTYGERARQLMIGVGFNPSKVSAIHNCLDHPKQVALRNSMLPAYLYKDHFGNSNPVLIFIGRLTPVKQLDMLLDAVSLLKQRGEEYNIVYVGDGSERSNLEQKTASLGLTSQTWFYGACYDQKTNAELIYNADLCVAPGNIGLTAMHTLVFGTPALTHNDFNWQMPEFEAIHEGLTGCFFERNSVESLADTISRWFSEKSACREEVRQACFKEIDEYWTPEFELNVLRKVIQ